MILGALEGKAASKEFLQQHSALRDPFTTRAGVIFGLSQKSKLDTHVAPASPPRNQIQV